MLSATHARVTPEVLGERGCAGVGGGFGAGLVEGQRGKGLRLGLGID